MAFNRTSSSPGKPGARLWTSFFLTTLVIGIVFPALSPATTLKQQVLSLAASASFQVEGLDRLGNESAKAVHGDAPEQLRSLLSDYNYLLIQGRGARIERVSITSRKDLAPRFNPTVATTRYGVHHQVEAILTGPDGATAVVPLLVDTGASTLVLPQSMSESLGFTDASLRSALSQTASDTVPIKMGMLRSVQVGQVMAEHVEVSFFPDERLQNARLLGMSFLNRFRFSLDDERNELTLMAK